MKKLTAFLLILSIALSLTACGNAKKEPVQEQPVQEKPAAIYKVGEEPEEEDITATYSEYGPVSEDDAEMISINIAVIMADFHGDDEYVTGIIDEIAAEYNITAEEVWNIYNNYWILHEEEMTEAVGFTRDELETTVGIGAEKYSASDAILGCPIDEFKMIQIGSLVIDQKLTLGEIASALNAADADVSEVQDHMTPGSNFSGTYAYQIDEEDLNDLEKSGYVLLKTDEGVYVSFRASNGDNVDSLSNATVTTAYILDPNVYLPGGVHVGMSFEELTELLKNAGVELSSSYKTSNGNLAARWLSRQSTYNTAHNCYVYVNKESHLIEGLQFTFDWRE